MGAVSKSFFRGSAGSLFALALMVAALFSPAAGETTAITEVNASVAGFVGQSEKGPYNTPVRVTSFEAFAAVFGTATAGLANPYLAPSVYAYFSNGGGAAYIVRVPTAADEIMIGRDGGVNARTGLQALLNVDEVAAVAIPGATSAAVQHAMIAHCEGMQDRIALLDPNATADIAAVTAQGDELNTSEGFAALYYPWIKTAYYGTEVALPPSGYAAGVYARTSPKDAPAGLDAALAWVSGVTDDVDTTKASTLTAHNINPIRYLYSDYYVWGARTLAADAQWRYVSVRREAMVIEESIYEGTLWSLLAYNDELLWVQLRYEINAFMNLLFRQGWFQGASPDDAYFVRVGLGTSMTQADIDNGLTIMIVGYAPLYPAEFYVSTIVQDRRPVPPGTLPFPLLPVMQMLLEE